MIELRRPKALYEP
ncbi:hypothetical protein F383_34135 [Gossypium arboreum]|uniref:Uncharacterized protein n=1 Tax=Gossypium arboreum TaxID=29729 RepID=A0A0B0N4E0_GOSAR|nr:hypothetical protein F383_34135 [Gossypium arboreum]